MDNLVNETNIRLADIISNLTTIKNEYEEKLKANSKEIDAQLEKVQKYKAEFFESKAKIEKMNADIEGFETDYQKLVERFKDDELANILIAANKEISLKIDERKRKIVKDKNAMNELVDKAENVKSKLVKLTAEKKALELCLNRILDSYNYYSKAIGDIIEYSSTHKGNLTGDANLHLEDNSYEEVNESIEKTDISVEEDFTSDENEDFDNYDEADEAIPPIEDVENNDESIMDDIEDEDTGVLQPIDISDMVKDEPEVSDYDNEEVVEGNEHKIVIEDEKVDSFVQDKEENDKREKKDKKDKKKKEKDEKEEDINIDVDFDDSLEDDDSLYE